MRKWLHQGAQRQGGERCLQQMEWAELCVQHTMKGMNELFHPPRAKGNSRQHHLLRGEKGQRTGRGLSPSVWEVILWVPLVPGGAARRRGAKQQLCLQLPTRLPGSDTGTPVPRG